ncbi:hypothetical protein FF2_024765 [Malus domestica]
MGCTQSKIENEEAVSRCKDRKLFMKEAVSYHNVFIAAHSSYAIYNTVTALSDYAQGAVVAPTPGPFTVPPPDLTSAAAVVGVPTPLPFVDNFPPPLPSISSYTLQRAASML